MAELFYRKIENDLEKWYEGLSRKKKALMVKGPRQVGKTTTISRFLNKHYENVLEINFKANKKAKEIFEGDLDANTIIARLKSRYPDVNFIPGHTVFFFDEIQDCNGARGCLKFLMLDGRYDVACSGSLLGISGYNESGPNEVSVGFEYPLEMHSMDFEEYLLAKGIPNESIEKIRAAFIHHQEIDGFLHGEFSDLFREYLCIGGMPEVVQTYLESRDLFACHKTKTQILSGYEADFAKHLNKAGEEEIKQSLLAKILFVYRSIPAQLASDRGRFVVSHLGKNARRSDYEAAIEWLCDSGLTVLAQNVSSLQKPLSAYAREGYYKIYVQDTGLLLGMLPYYVTDALYSNSNDIGVYKGAIYENIIADALHKDGFDLFYYRKDSGLEIDFVEEFRGDIALIEVKSKNGDAKASRTILNDEGSGVSRCIKFTSSNVGDDGRYYTIPHYMAFLLDENTAIAPRTNK